MKNTFSQIRQANTRMRGEQTEKKKARRRKALTHAQSHEIEKRNTSSIVHEHVPCTRTSKRDLDFLYLPCM